MAGAHTSLCCQVTETVLGTVSAASSVSLVPGWVPWQSVHRALGRADEGLVVQVCGQRAPGGMSTQAPDRFLSLCG